MSETEKKLAALERRVRALEDENAFYKRWCAAHAKWDDACFKVMISADGSLTAIGTMT